MSRHLVLACIHRITEPDRRPRVEKSAEVGEVIRCCTTIGLRAASVRRMLVQSSIGDPSGHDLVEIRRNEATTSIKTVGEGDTVILTPRACYLLEHMGKRYHYSIALMRKRGDDLGKAGGFKHDVTDVLTTGMLCANLKCLGDLCDLSVAALAEVRKHRSGNKRWLRSFRRRFCIGGRRSAGGASGHEGLLFALRFLNSHERFLRSALGGGATSGHQITHKIIDQYSAVKARYEALVNDLERGQDIDLPVETCSDVDWSAFQTLEGEEEQT